MCVLGVCVDLLLVRKPRPDKCIELFSHLSHIRQPKEKFSLISVGTMSSKNRVLCLINTQPLLNPCLSFPFCQTFPENTRKLSVFDFFFFLRIGRASKGGGFRVFNEQFAFFGCLTLFISCSSKVPCIEKIYISAFDCVPAAEERISTAIVGRTDPVRFFTFLLDKGKAHLCQGYALCTLFVFSTREIKRIKKDHISH